MLGEGWLWVNVLRRQLWGSTPASSALDSYLHQPAPRPRQVLRLSPEGQLWLQASSGSSRFPLHDMERIGPTGCLLGLWGQSKEMTGGGFASQSPQGRGRAGPSLESWSPSCSPRKNEPCCSCRPRGPAPGCLCCPATGPRGPSAFHTDGLDAPRTASTHTCGRGHHKLQ